MFSKTCKYAIRAILFLATYSNEEKKLGIEQIAEGLDIPKHFLAKILQQLTRHNLASSTKGRNGGFYLSEANKDGTLLPVIEAIDGPETFSSCILGLPECNGTNPCVFHDQALAYRTNMLNILGKESIRNTAVMINLKNFKL